MFKVDASTLWNVADIKVKILAQINYLLEDEMVTREEIALDLLKIVDTINNLEEDLHYEYFVHEIKHLAKKVKGKKNLTT